MSNSNIFYCADKISDIINPYNPSASEKIRINMISTNILSCCPNAHTPASQAIPIATPSPKDDSP